MSEVAEVTDADINAARENVRAKILHILHIYPRISPTMLQGGLGPSCKPSIWRTILTEMIDEGLVEQVSENHKTPSGRNNTYTIIQMVKNDKE